MFLRLLHKDISCLLRARGFVPACFAFSLLLVVVASFSFRQIGYKQSDLLLITPGMLWLIFLFSSMSVLTQSFVIEKENSAISGLILSGAVVEKVFLSKFLVNFVFIFLQQLFVVLAHSLFFAVSLSSYFSSLILITLLASLAFSSLGTLFAFISVSTRGRELLLPILLFPLLLPLLAAVVFLTKTSLTLGYLDYSQFWFIFLIVFASLSFLLSLLLFEYAVKE